jgi:hypothetical protein
MQINQVQKPSKPLTRGSLSDESFITLFMVGVLIVLFGIASLVVPNFYKAQNIINLVTNNWFIIILGIGVTFLLITGNFDMSVGGVIALTCLMRIFLPGRSISQNHLQWPGCHTCRRRAGAAVRNRCWWDQCLLHRSLESPFHYSDTGHDDAGTRHGSGDHAGRAAEYQLT